MPRAAFASYRRFEESILDRVASRLAHASETEIARCISILVCADLRGSAEAARKEISYIRTRNLRASLVCAWEIAPYLRVPLPGYAPDTVIAAASLAAEAA